MSSRTLFGCSILILTLITGTAMADLFGKSSLSPEWVERFQDLSKLNAYAVKQPVHLSNLILTGWDISGAKLPGAQFEDTEWKDVKLERGVLSNVMVRKSKLQGVSFDHGVLTDVTFEDTELRSTSFFKAKLQRVRFIRCKFNGVNIDETVDSTIEIIDSKILSSSLSEGQLTATVKNSTLKDVEFTDLENPSALVFEKSELKDVDMSRSKLNELKLIETHTHKSGMTTGEVGKAIMSKSQLHFGMSETTIRELLIDKSEITLVAFDDAQIGTAKLIDCGKTERLNFFEAKIERLHVGNCELNNLDLAGVDAGELLFQESTLKNADFKGSKIKSLALNHVLLDGKNDFTNTQVDAVTMKNLKKSPTLNLITTGSNVKIE